MNDKVTIDYINEAGCPWQIEINNPGKIHHTWYSSKRNILGVYEKHEVTMFGAVMAKLKKCTKVKGVFS